MTRLYPAFFVMADYTGPRPAPVADAVRELMASASGFEPSKRRDLIGTLLSHIFARTADQMHGWAALRTELADALIALDEEPTTRSTASDTNVPKEDLT